MANLFNSVKIKNHKRNKFNLSHSVRLTTEFGRLTPIMCEPVLPADKFEVSTTLKIRFAPMTFPVMERFKAYVHYWFVPNRILWDNWEEFITGGESGMDDLSHPYPFIRIGGNLSGDDAVNVQNFVPGSLYDYLGFPAKALSATEITNLGRNPLDIDALPFMAYQKIYDEFYRDQNLENKFELWTYADGQVNNTGTAAVDNAYVNGLMSIRYRAWKKDYFTSALPDPQRGPDVTLPMFGELSLDAENLPISVTSVQKALQPGTSTAIRTHSSGGEIQFLRVGNGFQNDDQAVLTGNVAGNTIEDNIGIDSENVRMASINDVRKGFALQRLYELAARVGGRYAENILGNFGVHAGDARLQRPEYLGGSVVPVYVGDVLQTSESNETPLGMPAGVAGALGSSKAFRKSFYEHGWIIGILSIVPEATYFQGMPRKFLKRDRLDFAWPLLANLGEQEIMNQELFFQYGVPSDNVGGFGYTPRYAEYRFGQSGIHGDFRTSLADFHDARKFEGLPALNKEFITVKPDGQDTGLNRIFAVTDAQYDHLWVHLYNDVLCRRKLPKYGTPI